MNKIKVLHIGIKNYPFNSAFDDEGLIGIRGGGMNKYCNILIESFPNTIETFIITQRLKKQCKYEFINNAYVYRLKTFGNRALRQVIVNTLSFIYAFKIIKKNKVNLIHGHMQIGIFLGFLLGKIFRIPIVGTTYSFNVNEGNFFHNKVMRFIESNFYELIDKLVFETAENLQKAAELRNLQFKNSIVINTGIKLPHILPNNRWTKCDIRIFYIGRIIKIKAIDKLILSVLYLPDNVKEHVKIDIIGEGELFEPYKNLIKSKNLSKYITMHGFINDLVPFYFNSDIFILPSDMEGLSISLLEAMSYGKACVINDFGVPFSNYEVYTMTDNSAPTIAKAIEYLYNNSHLIKTLGNNARTRIEKDFSIQLFSKKYVELYSSFVD